MHDIARSQLLRFISCSTPERVILSSHATELSSGPFPLRHIIHRILLAGISFRSNPGPGFPSGLSAELSFFLFNIKNDNSLKVVRFLVGNMRFFFIVLYACPRSIMPFGPFSSVCCARERIAGYC